MFCLFDERASYLERLKSEQNSGDLLDRHQNNRTVQIADKSKSSNKNICYSNGKNSDPTVINNTNKLANLFISISFIRIFFFSFQVLFPNKPELQPDFTVSLNNISWAWYSDPDYKKYQIFIGYKTRVHSLILCLLAKQSS